MTAGGGDLAARIAALEARLEIAELLARYVRAVDAADLDEVRELFDPQISWVSPGRVELEGIEAVADYYGRWFASPYRDTRHHLSNVTVELAAGGEEAVADSYYLELASYDELSIVGYGNYRDVCRRSRGGGWRIVRKEVEMLGLARLDEGWAGGLFTPEETRR